MTEAIFIGVDGGASKSRVRIENCQGELLAEGTGGPANIRYSVDRAWHAVNELIHQALSSCNLDLSDPRFQYHVGLGLAGLEVVKAQQDFTSRSHSYTTIKLASDAHTACIGAHGGHEGAIIIAGTGTVGYQVLSGRSLQVGGWGFPHGDEGGGAWLGLEAVRLTLQSLDGRVETSPLLQDIYAIFGSNVVQLMEWLNQASAAEFAALVPKIISYQESDPWAQYLLQRAASEVERIGMLLMHQSLDAISKEASWRCSLLGGVAPFIQFAFSDAFKAKIHPPIFDACKGAILMIKQEVDYP